MSDGTYRGRWVDEVFRTPHVSAEVKVFLLFLATYYMDPTGRVSEPRELLAQRLGCHPRNITAKFKAAIGAGLMEQTVRGQKGQTAVYRALVLGSLQGDDSRHPEKQAQGDGSYHPEGSQGAGFYHPEENAQGAGFYHPEHPQGDDSRPAEGLQGDDSRHPTYKATTEASDNGEVAEVIALFDEERKEPPPAGASAPTAEKRVTSIQTVVAAYIDGVKDATGERPDRRRIGHISKQAKTLVDDENRDPELLAKAARFLGHKIVKGYTDLGQEYLMAAAASRPQSATGTDGKYAPGSGSQVPDRNDYNAGTFV
ncbi:MAG: hypothetical protein JWO67_1049 [Streptosporangiaceae bacterium]|nr:hypothetical protein [Streptosporangiaceae bacterium]